MRLSALTATMIVSALSATGETPFAFTAVDLKLLADCRALDRQLEDRGLVFHDTAFERRLGEFAAPALPKAPLERVEWRFMVRRDPWMNSFAMPNGSVDLHAALIGRVENDDQLAAVLAHHVLHVTARHGYLANRRIRRSTAALNAGGLAGAIVGGFGILSAIAADASPPLKVIMSDGYSRDWEAAADQFAMDVLASSGRERTQLRRLLSLLDDNLDPEWLPLRYTDHPTAGERLARMRSKDSRDPLPPAPDARYADRAASVLADLVPLAIDARRYRTAVAAAERLNNPFLLGEAYRALGPRTPRPSAAEKKVDAQRSAIRAVSRETEDEEARRLAATPDGSAALEANRRKAEDCYRKAIAQGSASAKPYLGLGMLYQDEARRDAAADAFRRFLELASPSDPQRSRAERRLQQVTSSGGKQ